MPARDFTKQERTLFYANVAIIACSVLLSSFFSKKTVRSFVVGMAQTTISRNAVWIGFLGMFLMLMGAQFCRGWNVSYLIIQILILLWIVGMMGMCYVFAAFIPSFGDLTDPDYKQFFVSASESILSFLQNNKDLQSLYPYLEENLGFCGLYSFSDVLGADCAFSSKTACTEPKDTFLSLIVSAFALLFKSCGNSFIVLLVVEIVFLVLIIIANKSSKDEIRAANPQAPLIPSYQQPYPMYQGHAANGSEVAKPVSAVVQMSSV